MKDRRAYHKAYYAIHKLHLAELKAHRQKHDLDYRLASVLRTIVQRCNDSRHTSYKYYGGKGIENFLTFEDVRVLWLRDGAREMKRPSIDRIDNNDDYTFDNCRFIELADNASRAVRKGNKEQANG